jgi:hypothetical protein
MPFCARLGLLGIDLEGLGLEYGVVVGLGLVLYMSVYFTDGIGLYEVLSHAGHRSLVS